MDFLAMLRSIVSVLRFVFLLFIGFVVLTYVVGGVLRVVDWLWPEPLPAHADVIEYLELPADPLPAAVASWYDYSLTGAPDYSRSHQTAASRSYTRGSMLRVCRADDPGTCVTVRVNDYGPDASVHPDREIDLSSAAFQQLAPLATGLVRVTIEKL